MVVLLRDSLVAGTPLFPCYLETLSCLLTKLPSASCASVEAD